MITRYGSTNSAVVAAVAAHDAASVMRRKRDIAARIGGVDLNHVSVSKMLHTTFNSPHRAFKLG